MKLNKKKVLAIALAVCLIAILSMSTLAWFSDSKNVTNEFLVAGSDDQDPDEIFSVKVSEDTPDGTDDEDGYIYENILPGDQLKKTVHVENTGSYDQYIRVTVTISDAQAWIAAMGNQVTEAQVMALFEGFDATKWHHIWNNRIEDPNPTELIFVMYYNEKLAPDAQITVFEGINIPTTLTQEQAAAFAGGFTINVKADAIQTENVLPDNYVVGEEAYYAFDFVANN